MKAKPTSAANANIYFTKDSKIIKHPKRNSEVEDRESRKNSGGGQSSINRTKLKKSQNSNDKPKSGSTKLRKYFKKSQQPSRFSL